MTSKLRTKEWEAIRQYLIKAVNESVQRDKEKANARLPDNDRGQCADAPAGEDADTVPIRPDEGGTKLLGTGGQGKDV